jgi:hypothetical protein
LKLLVRLWLLRTFPFTSSMSTVSLRAVVSQSKQYTATWWMFESVMFRSTVNELVVNHELAILSDGLDAFCKARTSVVEEVQVAWL